MSQEALGSDPKPLGVAAPGPAHRFALVQYGADVNDAEIYRESSATVQAVARRAGVDSQYAESVLDDLHHVIDRLLMDNHSVLLSPLVYAARNDPVVQAIAEGFTDEDWENPEGYKLPPGSPWPTTWDFPSKQWKNAHRRSVAPSGMSCVPGARCPWTTTRRRNDWTMS